MGTKCGPGSTEANTVNLRTFLRKVADDFNVNRVLDLGCGDLYWITIDEWSFDYLGVDDNIRLEAKQRASERVWDLLEADVRNFSPPDKYDLTICKDVLRHHNESGIIDILSGVKSPYFLSDYDEKTHIIDSYHRPADDYCLQANKVNVCDWLGAPIASVASNELPSKRFGLWKISVF